MPSTFQPISGQPATFAEAVAFLRECRYRYLGKNNSRNVLTRARYDAVIRLLEECGEVEVVCDQDRKNRR